VLSSTWQKTAWMQRRLGADGRPRDAMPRVPGLASAFGMMHCEADCERLLYMANGRHHNMNARTSHALLSRLAGPGDAGDAGQARVHRAPHLLASNLLLRNSAETRALVGAWVDFQTSEAILQREVKGKGLLAAGTLSAAICASHPPEQNVMTMLARNMSIPVVNPCPYLPDGQRSRKFYKSWAGAHSACYTRFKSVTRFLQTLRDGRFEVQEHAGGEEEAELVSAYVAQLKSAGKVLAPGDLSW
jgi:hypothetical protein